MGEKREKSSENKKIKKIKFWRDSRAGRSCSSGMSANVIQCKDHQGDAQEYINYLRDTVRPASIEDLKDVTRYHKQILKDCLENVNKNKTGYLYNDEQLKNFIVICGNINVKAKYNVNDSVWIINKI